MKNFIRKATGIATVGFASATWVACGGTEGTTDLEPSRSVEATEAAAAENDVREAHPDPVVSLAVGDGPRVELYDFGEGRVLALETGKAGGTLALPRYGNLVRSGELVQLFKSLRPDLEVPSELVALQARAQAAPGASLPPPTAPVAIQARHPRETDSGGGHPGLMNESPSCDNYCCNYNWLTTTLCPDYGCYGGACESSWFLYDYGWSYANSSDINFWTGAACSVSGTSTFRVDIGGYGGTWSVNQGYYVYYDWYTSGSSSATSSVNSQSSQHTHTYCGGVYYD